MKLFKNTSIHWIFLSVILLGAFIVRLYRFDFPIADWHSWRQADTSAVSQNFAQNGWDILHPTYYDISNIQSGKDNPEGYRYVEFPLYNIFQAGLFKGIGILSIEEWGRLISIFASLGATILLYLLVTKYSNRATGLFAAFFYAFTPYNIFYGRTILPDTSMVAASLAGIYFFDVWIEANSKFKVQSSKLKVPSVIHFILALIFTSAAMLLKPYALFFTVPIFYIAYKAFGFSLIKKWQLYIFAIIAVIPLVLWRQWITQFPEGVPSNLWLLNGNGIRFRPAFFRWILYERLTKLILGYAGIFLAFIGVVTVKAEKNIGFFISFAVASILYIVIFATGNVQHDYYQILIMPTVAIFCALGSYRLFIYKNHLVTRAVLGCIIVVMFYFSWMQARDYFNINNHAIVEAGQKADQVLPRDAKVIAPYGGDTTLLYHIHRKGWPAFQDSLENLVKKGASYIILVNPTASERADYSKKFKTIASSSSYAIFKLQ